MTENKVIEAEFSKPVEKTEEDLKKEFNELCLQAGSLQYQVFCFNKQIDLFNEKMRDLNIEGLKLKQNQQKKEESKS